MVSLHEMKTLTPQDAAGAKRVAEEIRQKIKDTRPIEDDRTALLSRNMVSSGNYLLMGSTVAYERVGVDYRPLEED